MGATEKIARFIVDTGYEDIPRDAVEKAKRTALDCLGAALGRRRRAGQPNHHKLRNETRRAVPGIRVWRWSQSFGCRRCPGQRLHCPRPGLRRLRCEDRPPQCLGSARRAEPWRASQRLGPGYTHRLHPGTRSRGQARAPRRLQADASPPESPNLVRFHRRGCGLRQAPQVGCSEDQNGIGHRRQLCLRPVGQSR